MADPTRDRDDTTTPEISRLELLLAAITGDTDRIAAHLAQREAGTAWVERAGPSAPALGAWLRRHTFDAFETDEFAQLPDGANPLLAHI